MARLQVKTSSGGWANAAASILYKFSDESSWDYTPFQVADARHSKTKAMSLVRRWLKSGNPARRKNPAWKPGKWIKATAVRIRKEAGRFVMDVKR